MLEKTEERVLWPRIRNSFAQKPSISPQMSSKCFQLRSKMVRNTHRAQKSSRALPFRLRVWHPYLHGLYRVFSIVVTVMLTLVVVRGYKIAAGTIQIIILRFRNTEFIERLVYDWRKSSQQVILSSISAQRMKSSEYSESESLWWGFRSPGVKLTLLGVI